MRVKAITLIIALLLVISTIVSAETVAAKHRQKLWHVVSSLPQVPSYTRVLQYSDLSRMEFAVVLGRVLEEHQSLKPTLRDTIKDLSWELQKLGYKY